MIRKKYLIKNMDILTIFNRYFGKSIRKSLPTTYVCRLWFQVRLPLVNAVVKSMQYIRTLVVQWGNLERLATEYFIFYS